MNPSLQRQIELAVSCLQGAYRQAYLERLAAANPPESQAIQNATSCLSAGSSAQTCFSSSSYQNISASTAALCRELINLPNDNRAFYQGVRFAQQAIDRLLQENPPLQISPEDREALQPLLVFEGERRGLAFEDVARRLRANPAWRERLLPYDQRTAQARRLSYELCTDVPHETHYLQIEGLSYQIPVLTRADVSLPWRFLEQDFKIIFEMLKVMIGPADFERLLQAHADGQHYPLQFAISIFPQHSSPNPPRRPRFVCSDFPNFIIGFGIDGGATVERSILVHNEMSNVGIFDSPQAQVENFPANHPLGASQSSVTRASIRYVIVHEFGHWLANALLNENGSAPEGVRRLYAWTITERNLGRRRDDLIPSHRQNFYLSSSNGEANTYALGSADEFLAEMFAEYFWSLFGESRSREAGDRARFRIMSELFSAQGFNREALSPENIQRIYSDEGMSIDFSSQDLPGERYRQEMGEQRRRNTPYAPIQFTYGLDLRFSSSFQLEVGAWRLSPRTHGEMRADSSFSGAHLGLGILHRVDFSRLFAFEFYGGGGIGLVYSSETLDASASAGVRTLWRPFSNKQRSPYVSLGFDTSASLAQGLSVSLRVGFGFDFTRNWP